MERHFQHGHFRISLTDILKNNPGEHYAVDKSALHASEHEFLAFSSHFARVFHFRLPKSTTYFFLISFFEKK